MSIKNAGGSALSAVGLLLLVSASGALGQQSADQQKCLNKLNAAGKAVASAQGGANFACLRKAGAGTLIGSAQSCLTADAMGNVQRKKNMTTARETNFCGTPPSFGYTSAATINSATMQGALDLEADVFGTNLDAAVINCDSNKPGCQCQRAIFTKVKNLAAAKFGKFVNCKKKVLHDGATSAASLVACVNDPLLKQSIAADSRGTIQGMKNRLTNGIINKCDTPGVTAGAFPGACNSMSGATLGACFDAKVECRVCQMINEIDGLFINCDLFDDQVANASCASGAGPTPTSTPTPTQTATPTETSTRTATPTCPSATTTYQGSLVATTGRFNYNLILGIPGSDAACNSNFACSHTCTYAELQTANAANELVGAVDTSSNPVTSFWAIDLAQPADRQCNQVVPWDYQTAHTGRGGDSVALTAGHLGTFTPGKTGTMITGVCASSHWVGCCR